MDTDVFLLCFAVNSPVSLCNIRDEWLPDVRKFRPKAPVMLIGLKSDLRSKADQSQDGSGSVEDCVTPKEAERMARDIGVSKN